MAILDTVISQFFEKVIPKKYRSKVVIVILLITLGYFANDCRHIVIGHDEKVLKELKELRELYNGMDKRLKNVESLINRSDSITGTMRYDILSVKSDQKQNYNNLVSILEQGFTITKEELVRLHVDQKIYIATRFNDFNKFVITLAKDTSRRYIIIPK